MIHNSTFSYRFTTFYLFTFHRGKLEREYAEVKERVFSKYPTKFPAEKFSIELFLWSFIMLVSSLKVSVFIIFFISLIPYCDICVLYIDLDSILDPGNSYLSYFVVSYFIVSYLILSCLTLLYDILVLYSFISIEE